MAKITAFPVTNDKIISLLERLKDCTLYDNWQDRVTLEAAIDTINRMKAQTVIIASDHDTPCSDVWYVCPGCRCAIGYPDSYCRYCGQALKWEKEKG